LRLASLREQENAKGGETEEEQPLARIGDEGSNMRKIIGQEIANEGNNIAHEEAEAEPAWKNAARIVMMPNMSVPTIVSGPMMNRKSGSLNAGTTPAIPP
jgi:hypothetical protein